MPPVRVMAQDLFPMCEDSHVASMLDKLKAPGSKKDHSQQQHPMFPA